MRAERRGILILLHRYREIKRIYFQLDFRLFDPLQAGQQEVVLQSQRPVHLRRGHGDHGVHPHVLFRVIPAGQRLSGIKIHLELALHIAQAKHRQVLQRRYEKLRLLGIQKPGELSGLHGAEKYPLVMAAKPQAQLLHDSAVRLLRVLPVAKKAGQTILLQCEQLRAVRVLVQKAIKPYEGLFSRIDGDAVGHSPLPHDGAVNRFVLTGETQHQNVRIGQGAPWSQLL